MADIRVLIADDIAQVRRELRTLLVLSGRVQVAGEAADGAEAVRLAALLQADVVLMDLEMPVLDGYSAAAQIKAQCPHCRVIALSIHEGQLERAQALRAGMDCFIPKGAPLQDLLDAILQLARSSHPFQTQEG
jgi:DNA-binding NarL/FixJ family response regulator